MLDADRDGDPDRVRVYDRTLTLELLAQDGTGAWVATASTLTLPFRPEALLRMDCDGDAYADLYLHRGTQGMFVPLRDGQLQPPATFTHGIASPMPMPIAGDVDRDGDQDLAIFD